MGAWYCTRERVADALDIAATAERGTQIDAAIAAASASIDRDFHRRFTPTLATKHFEWPPRSGGNPSWILRLDLHFRLYCGLPRSGFVLGDPRRVDSIVGNFVPEVGIDRSLCLVGQCRFLDDLVELVERSIAVQLVDLGGAQQ